MEPKFWAPFLKKKIAQALKKSPKWRFFAQTGHTGAFVRLRNHRVGFKHKLIELILLTLALNIEVVNSKISMNGKMLSDY